MLAWYSCLADTLLQTPLQHDAVGAVAVATDELLSWRLLAAITRAMSIWNLAYLSHRLMTSCPLAASYSVSPASALDSDRGAPHHGPSSGIVLLRVSVQPVRSLFTW